MSERQLKGEAFRQLLCNGARALALLLAAAVFCSASLLRREESDKELRVLFIGNSLTYYNNLPSIIAALAEASGQKRLVFEAVVQGGFSLEDHWDQSGALKAIKRGGWDVVVMQQGPSASKEGRKLLLDYARRFSEEIRRTGARPALYMVWPSTSRYNDFDGVAESYRRAAREAKALLFPAGEAWRAAWRRDPGLELYSQDGLHPTPAGSYLVALVIYEQLYGRSPAGLPSRLKLRSGEVIEIPAGEARLMQEAAAEANRASGQAAKAASSRL